MQNSKQELKHRAYQFGLDVIRFADTISLSQSSSILVNQLVRAATSIGANVIEAQAASSKRDFTNYFTIALKSANETKFWLSLLKDSGKASGKKIEKLVESIDEIANILGASVLTLKGKR